MRAKEFFLALVHHPIQPTTERPPATCQITPLKYGGYEIRSSATPHLIATRAAMGGWFVFDLDNPQGEDTALVANDPHSIYLDSLVSSSQKK